MGHIHVPVSLKAAGPRDDRYTAEFLIDTGAVDSMAPAEALQAIGIEPIGRQSYELADGSEQEFAFGLAQIEVMGAITAGRVVFGPEGMEPILGVTALESAGIVIDPARQTLRKLPALRL